MNGPLKWHGGKHYLAPKIVALMPPHVHYVEPFFGGGSVLLAKNPDGVSEVANDKHGCLTLFWRVLQNEVLFAELQRLCEATPFSEAEWERAGAELQQPTTTVATAWAFFVRCRQSLAGRMAGFASLSRTRPRRAMNEQASAWLTTLEGLPAVHARLKRVAILDRDALDVIRQQDGPQTCFYCDPPYLHETRTTTKEYGDHEMDEEQHGDLLETLASIKGKFLLSGYPSPLYESFAALYHWRCHTFDLPNNSAGGDNKRRMVECVWCNFPESPS